MVRASSRVPEYPHFLPGYSNCLSDILIPHGVYDQSNLQQSDTLVVGVLAMSIAPREMRRQTTILQPLPLEERRKKFATAENAVPVAKPSPQRSADGQICPEVAGELPDSFSQLQHFDTGDETTGVTSSPEFLLDIHDIQKDSLIDAYYTNFHKFHPFLLPRKHFTRLYQDPSRQSTFRPLIAVMRLIGHIYNARGWSIALEDHIKATFSQISPTDPAMVQCRLLYSIALFWYERKADAKSQVDAAIWLATECRLFDQEFASKHEAGDPVLQECWRRTWWMLYIVDAYYAGTLGAMNFKTFAIESTVDLPCEEWEYESGDIPEPKTLDEFDSREFSLDETVFSSFAYLIGAVRCTALAISTVPKAANKDDSLRMIQAADSALTGWLLLLPKTQKQVMSKAGEIDELMFQAHMLIHVATIGLHRPLSDLKFSRAEGISSCAREPPLDTQTPDLVNVHTIRVLRSAEAQIGLLALTAQRFHHTPFSTCMASEGTLALIAACTFRLAGTELTIARGQIRMTIGCLKALGEIWPRTARNVREIQTIANHILGLGSKSTSDSGTRSSDVPDLSGGEGQGSVGSEFEVSSDNMDALPSLAFIDDLCGWYGIGDLDPNLSYDEMNIIE
ncbi:Transcription factor [Penicillium griseofulvum]|uniref:Transcription factor n=1 Tax=Penicillium patulum TaxID=5078 RepID=A0A135LMH7_PENPA|nr:Transcription factor [Penicillium griseofulvum]KXG50160.1 Transcription factor [Penicillium griseofulvum]